MKFYINVKSVVFIILLTILLSCQNQKHVPVSYGIVIHGGAGNIEYSRFTDAEESAYSNSLMHTLTEAYEILKSGGNSIDAVQTAIVILEDDSLFNAGKGAVFAANGKNELDAAIMEGADQNAGAVAGVSHIRNPILLARAVMESSPHVLLTGRGAEEFAIQCGFQTVDESYFYTKRRWMQLQKAKNSADSLGTVGAVALDKNGNLAAGTSTGGLTNKKSGRVGDSPIIGAGTYADNNSCAVSATGQGEYFIRGVIAYDIAARIEYSGMTLNESAVQVIHHKLENMGGTGGIIAIDSGGKIAMEFNTTGMFRAYWLEGGEPWIGMYGKDFYKNK